MRVARCGQCRRMGPSEASREKGRDSHRNHLGEGLHRSVKYIWLYLNDSSSGDCICGKGLRYRSGQLLRSDERHSNERYSRRIETSEVNYAACALQVNDVLMTERYMNDPSLSPKYFSAQVLSTWSLQPVHLRWTPEVPESPDILH